MFGEIVSLATPWAKKDQARKLVAELKNRKLKQDWFADFDLATSSSVFFCTVPDGCQCNFRGTDISQHESGNLPEIVLASQDAFKAILGDKRTIKASFNSSISMDGGNDLLTCWIFTKDDGKFGVCVWHSTLKFAELVQKGGMIPAKLISLVKKQDGINRLEGSAIVTVKNADEALDLRRRLLESFSGTVSLTYSLDISETDVLDLSDIGRPELGFDVADAIPADNFIDWFHGDTAVAPTGRSLICNIPLKKSQEGNVVCVHLDNFKNKVRLVLCTSADNEKQMKKLASTELSDLKFQSYTPSGPSIRENKRSKTT